jgi:hypothetical protein
MSLSLTRRRLAAALAVGAAALAAASAVAAPASAASSARFAPNAHPLSSSARQAAAIGHYNINGYNWGGYAASGGGFTSVSATWTQPAATCNSTNDLYAPWVGIDGYGSSTVEQTGVATDCSSGSPKNEPWYEMYPANPVYLSTSSYPVSAGDTISASVVKTASTSYKLTLSDNTKGWTYTTTKSLSAADYSAEVIIESPTASYPNFGHVYFSNCKVNGSAIGNYGPDALNATNGSITEATASALSGGTSFSMTYNHE